MQDIKIREFVSLSIAQNLIMNTEVKLPSIEKINTYDAENRILGENIYAKINIPEEDNAAVDGYAVLNKDIIVGKKYKIIGESKPGFPYLKKIKKDLQ